MDVAKPNDNQARIFCLTLGNSLNKQTVKRDGKEYSINVEIEGNTVFFNPLIDSNDAVELLEAGGIEFMINHQGSPASNNQYMAVVEGKHGIPGRNFNEAVSMAAYAIVTGQFTELAKEPSKIIGADEPKIILPGSFTKH